MRTVMWVRRSCGLEEVVIEFVSGVWFHHLFTYISLYWTYFPSDLDLSGLPVLTGLLVIFPLLARELGECDLSSKIGDFDRIRGDLGELEVPSPSTFFPPSFKFRSSLLTTGWAPSPGSRLKMLTSSPKLSWHLEFVNYLSLLAYKISDQETDIDWFPGVPTGRAKVAENNAAKKTRPRLLRCMMSTSQLVLRCEDLLEVT